MTAAALGLVVTGFLVVLILVGMAQAMVAAAALELGVPAGALGLELVLCMVLAVLRLTRGSPPRPVFE